MKLQADRLWARVVYRRTPSEMATERPHRVQQGEGEATSSEALEDVSRSVDQGLRRLDTLLQKLELAKAHLPSTEAPTSQSRRLAADVVAQTPAALLLRIWSRQRRAKLLFLGITCVT